MATIKDIAKKAGVSHGTASNVLNKKGNVSADKIKKVEEAAQELGYTLNHQAAGLRKGSVNLITVIIPYQSREKYEEFYTGMILRAEEKEFEISLVYLRVRSELKAILDKEAAKMPQSIVLLGLNPKEAEINLISNKVKIYVYNDKLDFSLTNVEEWFYDSENIVADIVNTLRKRITLKKVFFILNIFEQESYWIKEMRQQFKNLEIEKVYLDNSNRLFAYFELLSNTDSDDIILFLDHFVAQDFLNVVQWSNAYYEGNIPYIISFSSNQAIHNRMIKYYEFNYKRDGYNLVAQMIKNTKKSKQVILPAYKSFRQKEYEQPKNESSITILTLESPMSDALERLIPIFERRSGIKVEILQMPYMKLREKLFDSDINDLRQFDIIRLDVAWMKSIGERIYRPLTNETQIETINHSLTKLPTDYTHIHGIQYALPLDASVQVLFYRKDLFEDLLVQRQFFEMYKRKLSVPKTFHEFDVVSQYFSKEINPHSPIEYGHSYAQDNPSLLVSSVLPRINEKLNMNSSLSTDEIIDQCIVDYKSTELYSHKTNNIFWSNIARNFSNGLTAMEILYSNYAADILTTTEYFNKTDIGYSLIPGKESLLGGGSIGINHQSHKFNEAKLFLEWLYSNETSQIITSLGGVVHNQRVNENMDIIEIYPWMRKMNEYFSHAHRLKLGSQQISYETELEIGEYILSSLNK